MSNTQKSNKRSIGSAYEQQAAAFLDKRGYQLLEQNFYSRHGEIDLIAKEGDTLVFVEVKYRKSEKNGNPAEAVTGKKQQHMLAAARYYLFSHGYPEDTPCRFDVVAILGEQVTLYRDAFWV